MDAQYGDKRIGVYPGSFDPLTNGHLDIIRRASKLFDHLIVAVLVNTSKKNAIFTMEERVALIRKCTDQMPNVEVQMFDGLLVDFVKAHQAVAIVKGLRAVSDYEYELQMAALNKHIDKDVETIFLMADIQNSFLSSSIVKELARHGGDIRGLVPGEIVDDIEAKMLYKG
ncbi:MAG: pantetheine-phosphate adenylyltransferase [Clostridia bacterium]|nr:pantetheine-phosphate adenylyltransferase [Clostridia bacterium]